MEPISTAGDSGPGQIPFTVVFGPDVCGVKEPILLEFRANCGIVPPYRKWTLDPLPIASILKGPTLESELAKRSLADFVRHHRYKGVEIDVSRIPLRPCF